MKINQISDSRSATTRLGCLMATTLLINQFVIANVSFKEYRAINCCLAMGSLSSCLKPLYNAELWQKKTSNSYCLYKGGQLSFKVSYDCEMTACVWGESDKEQWVYTEFTCYESEYPHGHVGLNSVIFQKFLHIYALKSSILHWLQRVVKEETRCLVKLCCVCLILMLLHLKTSLIIIQTMCTSNQRWMLNTTISIWSYFVLHFI